MRKMKMREAMTSSPHTIGREQALTVAWDLMRKFNIRHLPVLDGGKLIGIVSERDLQVLDGIPGVDRSKVKVEEAMAQEVYVTSPDAPLASACEVMAHHKYGCIVIAELGKVVGIFSTVDAVRMLAQALNEAP